jgi:hypothetical protein
MAFASDKTMFEIYREKTFNKKFRVVYYTDLNEHNKESEINKALNGESIYDGFLSNIAKDKGKSEIKKIIDEMNLTDTVKTGPEITERLKDYLA